MKKKIFSTLLVLVLLCMPMLCLTGCGSNPGADTHFKASTYSISVKQGTTWQSLDESVISFEIDYKVKKLNPEYGEFWYVKQDTDNGKTDGSSLYDFASSASDVIWFYSGTKDARTTAIRLSDAVELYNVVGTGSWNTSTVTPAGVTRTLTLTYGGVTLEIDYTVTA